ncbi:MAG: molecular chaperone [Coriobacteriales bacterium]
MNATELLEYYQASTDTYRFLSQALFRELNQEAIDELAAQEWPRSTGNGTLDAGYAHLRRFFHFSQGDRRTQLACEYARIFLAAGIYGKEAYVAVPYESVFTSPEKQVMQESRDEVVRVFREDGFEVDPLLHEPEDHLSFELEYLAHMSERGARLLQAGDIAAVRRNLKRQGVFIKDHLLNWLPALLGCARSYATLSFYLGLLEVVIGSLEQSWEYLGAAYETPAEELAAWSEEDSCCEQAA